jgi:hypothetical protein
VQAVISAGLPGRYTHLIIGNLLEKIEIFWFFSQGSRGNDVWPEEVRKFAPVLLKSNRQDFN